MATTKKTTPATKTTRATVAPKAAPSKKATQPTMRKTTAVKKTATQPKATAKPEAKVEKVKKPKLVRDSFTIPKSEYSVLEVLKLRSQKLARPAKKSELLRAGIKALAAMTDIQFKAALADVPAIKTGRPKSAK
jgi:hypothetical protein